MNFFSSLRLRHLFAILIATILLGYGIYGGWSFKTLNELKVNGTVYKQIVQGKDLIADILPPPEYIIESYLVALQIAATTDVEKQNKLFERLKVLKEEYDTRHEFWSKEGLSGDLNELMMKQAHDPAIAFYAIAFDEFIPAMQKHDLGVATKALARMAELYEIHRQAIEQIVQLANKRNEMDEAKAKEDIQTANIALFLTLVISISISIATTWMISRRIYSQLGGELHYAASIVRKIAEGDLTVAVLKQKNDRQSLLHDMSAMQQSLSNIVKNIHQGTDTIATASAQIAAGNQDLSARTEEQASSLGETASAMNDLTSTLRQNADNVNHANQLTATASDVAVKGGAIVSRVVETMNTINESSRKISDIIGVIDGIAFQTNILALNASVEAARAGEQGRGFAVVATEVRNLAQRSASAAREIKALISDSVLRVEAGSKLADQAGTTINEVVISIKRVNDIMGEITTASHEQSEGIEQVNQAIMQMDTVTQQNAALVEEAAAAAESLQGQAKTLVEVVSIFNSGGSKNLPLLPSPS